jgi:type IV pilus assembly protein PilA
MDELERKGRRTLSVAVNVISGLVLLCCLGSFAMTIPSFLRMPVRAKQAECKTNLKLLFTAERAYRADHNALSATLKPLDWEPERGNRYAYFLGTSGKMSLRTGAKATLADEDDSLGADVFHSGTTAREVSLHDVPVSVGVFGTCPDCRFTAACVGNLDNDATLDVWSISSEERRAPDGTRIEAGMPFNEVNDVER